MIRLLCKSIRRGIYGTKREKKKLGQENRQGEKIQ
jgi:hypothetical protein